MLEVTRVAALAPRGVGLAVSRERAVLIGLGIKLALERRA